MKPIVPKPPNGPFFGTNLHGPSNKKLAIPLEAEISEATNVAMKKVSKYSFPLNNFGLRPQRKSMICTCGTLSIIGSEMYKSLRFHKAQVNKLFKKTYQDYQYFFAVFLFPLSILHSFSRAPCRGYSTFSIGDKIEEGLDKM